MSNTIGFIGSGALSSQVARLATAAGLRVILSNSRGPETLNTLVTELGARARAATPVEAVRDADLVIASIPFGAYKQLPAGALAGKIVIDTMNYYPARDGDMLEVATDRVSTSELVQQHLAGSRVVRALNNMDWVRLRSRARPADASDRSALPIAGDNAEAKAVVAEFLDTIGYDTVDLGPLAESWRSEPTTPVYVTPYIGKIPAEVDAKRARAWFLTAAGVTVSGEAVRSLTAQAVRHAKMFGDLRPAFVLALMLTIAGCGSGRSQAMTILLASLDTVTNRHTPRAPQRSAPQGSAPSQLREARGEEREPAIGLV